MRAKPAFEKLLAEYDFTTVVDFGCGRGPNHRKAFERAGKVWHGRELHMNYAPDNTPADCLWCSHVVEHLLNVNDTLLYWHTLVKPGGVVAVTVPYMHKRLVGGHVNLFTLGTLAYSLVMAGHDLSESRGLMRNDECSIIFRVSESSVMLPENLLHDAGDLEKLAHLMPPGMGTQGCDGAVEGWNWDEPRLVGRGRTYEKWRASARRRDQGGGGDE